MGINITRQCSNCLFCLTSNKGIKLKCISYWFAGEQNQPSTSSAADMGEEFQESEDFIQPRSRSRRGRKKLVIEESQEDESQQVLKG